MAVAVTNLIGCQEMQQERVQLAQRMLADKYQEEFVVYSQGKSYGTEANNTFTVIAYPEMQKDLKFEAEIEKEGAYMFDQYVSRKISAKIEQQVEKVLASEIDDFEVKIGASNKVTDTVDSNISIEEFVQLEDSLQFAAYIVVNKNEIEKMETQQLYTLISDIYRNIPNIKGSVRLYFTTIDKIDLVHDYLNETANMDEGFKDIVGKEKNIYLQIDNSRLINSYEEFAQLYGE